MQCRSSSIRARKTAHVFASRISLGFSLVELMVAIALSLLLLTGVVAIFSSSRVSYESTEQLSRVQETGRLALEQLSRHIRSSGFSGCSRQPNYVSTSLNSSADLPWDFLGGPVRGFEATGSGWTPAIGDESIEDVAEPDSDVLVVRGPRLDAAPMQVTVDMADPELPLAVSSTAGVASAGEVVMAYSCEAQSFFFATPAGNTLVHGVGGGNPGNQFASTNFPFRTNAEVLPVETVVYYVAASADSTPPTLPTGTTSLYRRAGTGAAEEIVQGVERLQVEYGVDTDNDRIVDTYQKADAVTDWERVVSVRLAMLVRSVEQYGTDTDRRTYQLLTDTTVNPPGDRRLREVFQATVSIRNRVRID